MMLISKKTIQIGVSDNTVIFFTRVKCSLFYNFGEV